jgi:hypothetical protein
MLITPSMSAARALRARADNTAVPAEAPPQAREPATGRPKLRLAAASRPGMHKPLRLPLMLFGTTLLLLIAHQGRLVELFFPLASFLVAAYFYRSSPAHYLSFVFWLFFLSPEVRRLADFVNGSFNPKSLVMIAPMLAVTLSGVSLITEYRAFGQRRTAPLVLIMVGLFYSFFVGMVQVGPAAAGFTLIGWLFPVLVAFRMVVTWRDYPVYHRVLLKTFVFGGLVMGIYGVIQYVSPPPWDAFWLIASEMASEGTPVPYGMRVCSTLNSSGPFSTVMMAVLLMSMAARGRTRIATGVVGIPALLFSSVRSAWGGSIIGLLYPLAMLDSKNRARLIGGVLGFALLVSPLTMIEQVAEPLTHRFDSIMNVGSDNSYQVRAAFYQNFMASALTDIAGQGLGATGAGTKLSTDDTQQLGVVFDSGFMEVPYVLGWPGTFLYTTGVLTLLWRAFAASRRRPADSFGVAGVGVAFALFAMMVFINTIISLSGMFFFVGVMLPVIGLRHARESGKEPGAPSTRQRGEGR